ncbi:hypothetical protein [Sphingomonas sp. G-3-2-10]|uniref:hypothetical protein n=1 Tax=Sphingomonas sp. G-3-2-10 TaxID=2728838 RepID=UPI00146CBC98|nr:hypothetical protein [Sphingomonas sp. G-3-2-10]NML06701.1 hypothetical protein [Sphingomonas sp. G-3-2-10]
MAGEVDLTQGRSPRYPRFPLLASVAYAKRLYDGAHRSAIDTLTAYKVMGFAGKSGASATALGAARQYGLVEAAKGGVRVSELGLQILEPSSREEYVHALHIAANKPQVFERILEHFDELPRSDEAIRAYLIRALDFSKTGADDCIQSLRETISQLPQIEDEAAENPGPSIMSNADSPKPALNEARPAFEVPMEAPPESSAKEMMRIPLTRDCVAELRFSGPLSVAALERLVRHIDLMKDVWAES